MGGTVIAALTTPKLAKHGAPATPFWVAAALMAAMAVIFWLFARFVAIFLYLPELLTGVHHLTKTGAGDRATGFAFLAVLSRPVGGWLSDRIGSARAQDLIVSTIVLAAVLVATYKHMAPLTICCLAVAVALGLGTGAVSALCLLVLGRLERASTQSPAGSSHRRFQVSIGRR
jgi:NNP family nitrate/nitrite transporter-like MFS transporter